MAKNQVPQQQIDDLEPDFVSDVVSSLRELNDMGYPETNEDLQKRIDDYFSFCQRTGNRPGIESLCLALHISRTTLFRWARGIQCDRERMDIINRAKSFINAFMEQAMTRGKINPASGIFLMKNWMNYKDTVSFDIEDGADSKDIPMRSAAEIARSRGIIDINDLPEPEKPEI